ASSAHAAAGDILPGIDWPKMLQAAAAEAACEPGLVPNVGSRILLSSKASPRKNGKVDTPLDKCLLNQKINPIYIDNNMMINNLPAVGRPHFQFVNLISCVWERVA
ncbi:hypothetical protein, partial [Rhizobium rhizogenes]|uniref:hypothetical protein n=1 Tax=Rhizobium rhizogenes TaxID=359 RepID=UPI00227158C8